MMLSVRWLDSRWTLIYLRNGHAAHEAGILHSRSDIFKA